MTQKSGIEAVRVQIQSALKAPISLHVEGLLVGALRCLDTMERDLNTSPAATEGSALREALTEAIKWGVDYHAMYEELPGDDRIKKRVEQLQAALAAAKAPTPDADLLERVEDYIREQRAASLEGCFAASAWDEMVKAAEALRQRKGA